MRKIFLKFFSINLFGAGLNFVTTILVVKLFGLDIFGDFVILSAYIGLFSLVYILIPSNYAIFKLQDSKNFNNIVFYNYIIGSFIAIITIYISSFFIQFKVNIVFLILLTVLNGFMGYFDIYAQAYNKLEIYYKMLLFSYITKFFLILLIYFINLSVSLVMLIIINILPIFISILYAFIKINLKIQLISIFQYILFIKNNFQKIKFYYINIILKRMKDNSLVILLSYLVSSDIIAIYNLFTKVSSFVLGQLRVVEVFFVNRENFKNINTIRDKQYLIGFIFQLFMVLVGLIYLKLSTDNYYPLELCIYSFLSYPYIKFILIRNKLLSEYKVNIITFQYAIYILEMILLYFIYTYFIKINLLILLISIVSIEIFNLLYLEFELKTKECKIK